MLAQRNAGERRRRRGIDRNHPVTGRCERVGCGLQPSLRHVRTRELQRASGPRAAYVLIPMRGIQIADATQMRADAAVRQQPWMKQRCRHAIRGSLHRVEQRDRNAAIRELPSSSGTCEARTDHSHRAGLFVRHAVCRSELAGERVTFVRPLVDLAHAESNVRQRAADGTDGTERRDASNPLPTAQQGCATTNRAIAADCGRARNRRAATHRPADAAGRRCRRTLLHRRRRTPTT